MSTAIVSLTHSAVDLGEALKISNRLENPKENVADEIHREEQEHNRYHFDPHGETSRQKCTA